MASHNILLIQSHQHRYDCLAHHGHAILKSPHFTSFAGTGVDFTRAYTPSLLPSAARASLLSGMWPTQMRSTSPRGLDTFKADLSEIHTLSRVLKDAGYANGWVGSFFHETKTPPEDLGFDDFLNDDHYLSWRRGSGLPPLPKADDWAGSIDRGVKPESTRLAWGVDRLLGLMDRYADQERPFFLRWDPTEPCPPNLVPFPYGSMYQPEDIKPWAAFEDSLEGKPQIQVQHRKVWGIDEWTWKKWTHFVSLYLGQISHLDMHLGRLLAGLEERGLHENTVVIYTSDQGAMIGDHGLAETAYMGYEGAIHVPLIVRWPGEMEAGSTNDSWVYNTLDIAATILDAADAPEPDHFEGQSLRDHANGSGELRQDIFVSWPRGPVGNFTQRIVRDATWKYVWNSSTGDELYKLVDDPNEMTNRIDDEDCEDELSRLQERLIDWMHETNDPVLDHWTTIRIARGIKT